MNFAAILAGGKGTRMGVQDKPKQFLMLANKPILVHTVEKFLVMPEFEQVLVLAPNAWIQHTKDLLSSYLDSTDKLVVIQGGETRNETIMRAIDYLESRYDIDQDTVLCTHDSVRPFVTYRIIKDNLNAMASHDACDTVIPASDTIIESDNGREISTIPLRSSMYQGQTPQTFKVKILRDLYDKLDEQQRQTLTDACKICVLGGTSVSLVAGEVFNIKVTYPTDLKMAQALLGMDA